MAVFGPGHDYSMVSIVDMSNAQYRCVIVQSAATVPLMLIASQTLDPVVGIVQSKPQSGEAGRVRVSGISKVVAGAAVNGGNALQTNATGYAILSTDSRHAFGRALESVGSGGTFTAVIWGSVTL